MACYQGWVPHDECTQELRLTVDWYLQESQCFGIPSEEAPSTSQSPRAECYFADDKAGYLTNKIPCFQLCVLGLRQSSQESRTYSVVHQV